MALKKQDLRAATPSFGLSGIRTRIRRLNELTGKFSAEALLVAQQRVPLKADEIKAYSGAMVAAVGALMDAKTALDKAVQRLERRLG